MILANNSKEACEVLRETEAGSSGVQGKRLSLTSFNNWLSNGANEALVSSNLHGKYFQHDWLHPANMTLLGSNAPLNEEKMLISHWEKVRKE